MNSSTPVDNVMDSVVRNNPAAKIKTSFAKIVVSECASGPVYEIMYIDPSDKLLHIGFASSSLDFARRWLAEEFEIETTSIRYAAMAAVMDEENDYIPRKAALGYVLNPKARKQISDIPGISICAVDTESKPSVEDQLLPCPICGGKVEVVGVNNGNPWHVWCETCGLEFGVDKDYYLYQVIEAWNRRACVTCTRKTD